MHDATRRPEDRYGRQFGVNATMYDRVFGVNAEHGRWVLDRLLAIEPEVRPHLSGAVLEIGAGTGQLTRALASGHAGACGELFVTDLSREMLALNRRARWGEESRSGCAFTVCNVRRLPFSDGTFDLVVGFDALHHVYEYEHGLSEIARVLKAGGLCIVKEPHRDAYRFMALVCDLLVGLDRRWLPLAGLTASDRQRLTRWAQHIRTLIRLEEENDSAAVQDLDDKYYLSPRVLARCTVAAGFARFSECNVFDTTRAFDSRPGDWYRPILLDTFRSLGISRRGLSWMERSLRSLDDAIGDRLLAHFPVNSVFLFWKG